MTRMAHQQQAITAHSCIGDIAQRAWRNSVANISARHRAQWRGIKQQRIIAPAYENDMASAYGRAGGNRNKAAAIAISGIYRVARVSCGSGDVK